MLCCIKPSLRSNIAVHKDYKTFLIERFVVLSLGRQRSTIYTHSSCFFLQYYPPHHCGYIQPYRSRPKVSTETWSDPE